MKATSDGLLLPNLLPPTKEKLAIKDKKYLVLELLWLIFAFAPYQLLLSLYRKFFPPPEKSLKGQVIVVTGAGNGLGRGLAIRFGKEGAKVAVVDIDRPSAAQTVQAIVEAGGIAKSYFTNVGILEEIHELRTSVEKELGSVNMLVNNAGLLFNKTLDNVINPEVRAVIEVNLLSHFWMVKEFLPGMKTQNSGHIVAICSMAGIFGQATGSVYAASKFGVNGLMDALRRELNVNPLNKIKTTTVLPYFINTSEHYTTTWDLRLPPLEIEDVVEATVTAVKNDEVLLSVPKPIYYTLLLKVLPTAIEDKVFSIFYSNLSPLPKEDEEKGRNIHIISDLSRK